MSEKKRVKPIGRKTDNQDQDEVHKKMVEQEPLKWTQIRVAAVSDYHTRRYETQKLVLSSGMSCVEALFRNPRPKVELKRKLLASRLGRTDAGLEQ